MSAQRPPTYAERLEVVVGYMNHLGYVHCVSCALGDGEDRKQPHESWTPMRRHNLASDADECDGCHRPLVQRACPDDGTCHHKCGPTTCFRVMNCGPLSGVFENDEWPADAVDSFWEQEYVW